PPPPAPTPPEPSPAEPRAAAADRGAPEPRDPTHQNPKEGQNMAHSGAPELTVDAAALRVAIIAASWHTQIMDGLVDGAQRAAVEAGADATLVRVPGSFELPVAAARLAPHFDAVVALGVVIRGGTRHFDSVCQAATDGLNRVAIDTRKPVGFGLLTCVTEQP